MPFDNDISRIFASESTDNPYHCMKKLHHEREMKIYHGFVPCELKQGDECWRTGIFHFNISRMIKDVECGVLAVIRERINVKEWFKAHGGGKIDEEYMPKVELFRPVIQGEIRPGRFEIIDGNHRMEKARQEEIEYVDSYKLMGYQLSQYLCDKKGYRAYIEYWNDKLQG